MDLITYAGQWQGQEIVIFCGPIKYRGTLIGVLDDGFLVLSNAAIMNPSSGDTTEYVTCVLNVDQISGLAYQEVVGRGASADAY